MQFGPCIHCGRIILIATGIQACGTCHILSLERDNEQTIADNDQLPLQPQEHSRMDVPESNDVHRSDPYDNQTAAAYGTSRPNVIDLQTAIGREDLPQMLQRFLSFFNEDDSRQNRASESEISALDTRILDTFDTDCKTECAICTEIFEQMELTKLPCNHEYHSECIRHWLKLNSSCPMCRQSILNTDHQALPPPPSVQNEPDLIIMRREMADRMYRENAPLHYMDDVD